MKKSPFSTPRRNGSGSQGSGWKSGGSPGRGYGLPPNYEYYSPNRSQSFGEDFIPFESSTPPSAEHELSGNWQSPNGLWQNAGGGNRRYSPSPGYNTYRNNNSRAQYYRDAGNSFHGHNKNYHRGNSHKQIDISKYMNLRSFLEDPWMELMRKLNSSNNFDESLNETSDFSLNSSVADSVRVENSMDEDNLTSSQDGDNCCQFPVLLTSQESIDVHSENDSDPHLDPKTDRNCND